MGTFRLELVRLVWFSIRCVAYTINNLFSTGDGASSEVVFEFE